MSLEWPLAPPGGLAQPEHSLLQEDANCDRPENAHHGPPHQRWRRNALQPPEVLRDLPIRDMCSHSGWRPPMYFQEYKIAPRLHCVLTTPHGTEAYLPHATDQEQRQCLSLKKPMGKMNVCKLFRYFSISSGYLVHSRRTMYMQAGRLFLFIRTSCQTGAIVTHVTTCQGRDHIVTIRSGDCVLVAVNVHFEPDQELRDLRERLRLISLHGPRYPEALGVIIGGLQYLRARGIEIQRQKSDLHRR